VDGGEAGEFGLGVLDVRDGEVAEEDFRVVWRDEEGSEGPLGMRVYRCVLEVEAYF